MRRGDHREVVLLGCDILSREIDFLIEKNGWPVKPCLMPSALHTDFHKLGRAVDRSLALYRDDHKKVFYGACHPLLDRKLEQAGTVRTPGQNCVDIYLGRALFDRELAQGAFFLFESWARNWREVACLAFGDNPAAVKAIFAYSHSYLLAIRTPCSEDFTEEAQEVSRVTGMELRWLDAGLEHLEANLARTLAMGRWGEQ